MSWWNVITTNGRLLTDVQATFERGEFRVSWPRLEPTEDIAILIDRSRNLAYLNRPFDVCQLLAFLHQYELYVGSASDETFLRHIERLLAVIDTPN
jgi:hypothetical protein